MNYTSKQIKKHGDLILLWEKSEVKPEMQCRLSWEDRWVSCEPVFDVHSEYRIKPQPSREEITTQWVKDNDLKVRDKVNVSKWEGIGKVFTVSSILSEYIECENDYIFEVEYLEKVKDEYVPFKGVDYSIFRDKWVKCKPILTEQISIQKVVGFNVESEQVLIGASWTGLKCAFEEYEFENGTPFGKKI